jgi:ubiquitin C-terminal hydrolase
MYQFENTLTRCQQPDDPANYTLHSVLVQGGDISSGHYIVYTRLVTFFFS